MAIALSELESTEKPLSPVRAQAWRGQPRGERLDVVLLIGRVQ
jgi:hypothetical protein